MQNFGHETRSCPKFTSSESDSSDNFFQQKYIEVVQSLLGVHRQEFLRVFASLVPTVIISTSPQIPSNLPKSPQFFFRGQGTIGACFCPFDWNWYFSFIKQSPQSRARVESLVRITIWLYLFPVQCYLQKQWYWLCRSIMTYFRLVIFFPAATHRRKAGGAAWLTQIPSPKLNTFFFFENECKNFRLFSFSLTEFPQIPSNILSRCLLMSIQLKLIFPRFSSTVPKIK